MSDGLSPEGRRRRSGFYLLSAVLFLWLAAMVSIQFYQGAQVGYGTGLGDGGRVPPAVVRDARTSPNAVAAVAATSPRERPISIGEGVLRVIGSLLLLAGIVAFWSVIISRIGAF